jgi:hypothetical protein
MNFRLNRSALLEQIKKTGGFSPKANQKIEKDGKRTVRKANERY